ncbi:hypothetical protein RRF57_011398 [Xylaria bambusicola]|uniref:Uncharacterized protein n=1 Tax=Xylaria bambusicola TaxID=326684 RepID=A0AAN7UZI3_9PEZI
METFVPVAEAEAVVLGIAADSNDEGEDKQADNKQDLAQRSPKLGFAVPLDCHEIDEGVEHEHDGDDAAGRHDVAPVVNDDVTGRHLKGHERSLEDEEVPPCGEPKGLVDVAPRESDEGRGDGQVGHHFRQTEGHGEDDGAPQREGEK